MYWTWATSGSNIPTTFVVESIKKRFGYTDKFLVQEGCDEGSTIAMDENNYVTEEAWNEMKLPSVERYRNMLLSKMIQTGGRLKSLMALEFIYVTSKIFIIVMITIYFPSKKRSCIPC